MVKLPEKIIDFHVHLFPDKLFDAIWDSFVKNYNWNIIHRYYYKECIARLRQSGVGTVVYSNYAHRAGIAEGLNRWNVKILEEYEGLYCFAAYHRTIIMRWKWQKGFSKIRRYSGSSSIPCPEFLSIRRASLPPV